MSSSSNEASADELRADLETLKSQLVPTLARDRARIEAEGRPFDLVSWALGIPDSHKYPGGPAFLVSDREAPTASARARREARGAEPA